MRRVRREEAVIYTHGTINEARTINRLGQDPEFRFTANGITSAVLNVCTVMSWINDSGEHEELEWHRIVAWGALAEKCCHLNKGARVEVAGSIHYRSWEHEGVKHYRTEIKAQRIIFLDRPGVIVQSVPEATLDMPAPSIVETVRPRRRVAA